MRIAYIYTALTTVGGADRVITEKANYLAGLPGYEVYVITDSQEGRTPVFPLSPKVKHIDLNIRFGRQYKHQFLLRTIYYFLLMREYKLKLLKTLREISPDISISALGRETDFFYSLPDKSIKIAESHISRQHIRNFHLMEQQQFPYPLIAGIWRKKMDKAVKKLSAFIVLTKADAEKWEPVRKSVVIPNALPFFDERRSTCTNKKIICVGRLNEQKGYDRLIEAWALVAPKHPDWSVYIYGNGELEDVLRKDIHQRGLDANIFIEKPVSNIVDKYLESSICVMASRFEGFGMALAEAMACGVPCVSFDCPYGPADIISDGNDGLLVENSNTTEMAEKICYLIENEDVRKEMGNRAKSNISRYKPDIVMKHWTDLFSELKKTVE